MHCLQGIQLLHTLIFRIQQDFALQLLDIHIVCKSIYLYPCEECGYRGQDKLTLNNHIREYQNHNSLLQSTILSDTTLEEFGVKTLQKISKRIQQNFDAMSLMMMVILKIKNQMTSIQGMLKKKLLQNPMFWVISNQNLQEAYRRG